ncbi:MAG: stage III sporulation protein AF [Lachnotalea sp.]
MITGIYEWIKNIAFYMILITAVMNVIPNNNYKKYINLFTGMVMIILVLAPISSWLGVNTRFDTNFIKNMYSEELSSMKLDTYDITEDSTSKIFEEYENNIGLQIEKIINEEGYYMVKVEVEMNDDRESEQYGSLESIDVVISNEEKDDQEIIIDKIEVGKNKIENPEEISVKNAIEDFYNIGLDNINVSIQR